MSVKTADIPDQTGLAQEKMFKEMWWCGYFFCCGRGCGGVGNPYIGSEAKEICLHSKCYLDDIMKPFLCGGMDVCLCMTSQCQFPPADGSPTCVCCNKKLAGGETNSWAPKLFDYTAGFGQTFWLYYLVCLGCGVSSPQADSRPCFAQQEKQLCISKGVKLYQPMQDGVLCSGLGTFLCIWDQLEIPPASGNPGCQICGFPKGKSSGTPFSYA
jgi:hypothetical protein